MMRIARLLTTSLGSYLFIIFDMWRLNSASENKRLIYIIKGCKGNTNQENKTFRGIRGDLWEIYGKIKR